jgi:hypothetical protein
MADDFEGFNVEMLDVFQISTISLMQGTVESHQITVLQVLQDFAVVVDSLAIESQ